MKQKWAGLLFSLCILMSGCQSRTASLPVPSSSSSLEASVFTSSDPASEEEGPSGRQDSEKAADSSPADSSWNLADAIITEDGAIPGTIQDTIYTLTYFGEGEPVSPLDDSRAVFSVNFADTLMQMASKALSSCTLDQSSREEIPEEGATLPEGPCLCLSVFTDTVGGTSHEIYCFPDGIIQISSQGQWDYAIRYRSADEDNYATLKAALEALGEESRRLPYQVSLFVSPQSFLPESEAVCICAGSDFPDAVTCGDFFLERLDGNVYTRLDLPSDRKEENFTLVPGQLHYLSFDLTRLEGGQEPGSYRVGATFRSGSESCELLADYAIDPAATEISYPLPPEMTPENAEYAEQYLRVWGGLGDVMQEPFSQEDMHTVLEGNLYLIFHNLDNLDGGSHADAEEIPADVLEDLLTRRFPLTAEEVRQMVPSSPSSENHDYYDAQRRVYMLYPGYGGGPGNIPVVVASSRSGELLTLECDWYSGQNFRYLYSTRLTLRLDEAGDFMYLQNEVLPGSSRS